MGNEKNYLASSALPRLLDDVNISPDVCFLLYVCKLEAIFSANKDGVEEVDKFRT